MNAVPEKYVRQITKDEMKKRGEAFRAMRNSIGLTLTQMAEEIGVFRTTISLWEKGKTVPQQDLYLIQLKYDEVMKKYKERETTKEVAI